MPVFKRLKLIRLLNVLFAVFMVFGACESTRYKHIKMLNNRPVPPKLVPRQVLGKLPSGSFTSHKVGGIVVMDSGADYKNESSLTYLQNLLERYTKNQRHGDLPAHYFIDQEGIVYAGRDPITPARIHVGDAFLNRSNELDDLGRAKARMAWRNSDRLDLSSYIVIMFLGDYEERMLNEEQEKNYFQLLAYLVNRHNISLHNVVPLKQLYPECENPGFYLATYVQHPVLAKNVPPAPREHRFLAPPQGSKVRNP